MEISGGSAVKILPAMQEMRVPSLRQEDHPDAPTPAWSGHPLQHSYLGNPTDRGAWQAIVSGVAKESDKT